MNVNYTTKMIDNVFNYLSTSYMYDTMYKNKIKNDVIKILKTLVSRYTVSTMLTNHSLRLQRDILSLRLDSLKFRILFGKL